MSRRGGLAELVRRPTQRLVEAAAERAELEVMEPDQRRMLEAIAGDYGSLSREHRRFARVALAKLNEIAGQGDDVDAEDRIAAAGRIRWLSRRDAKVQYATRLRNAFTFGRGVGTPAAKDADVQEWIDDLWDDPNNKRVLTTPEAQYRKGHDLWRNSSIYITAHNDGLDGRMLLGSLHHDRVVDVVRDPENWPRILYYKVREQPVRWNPRTLKVEAVPGPGRIVLYEHWSGLRELEAEGRQGPPLGNHQVRPGRVLHLGINRGSEDEFGEPELRAGTRWAAAFNDIMAGQVERAKAAQQFLMKAKAKGIGSASGLLDSAMRAVGRKSPLANAEFDGGFPEELDPPQRGARPGSQLWENDSLTYEPFKMDSGAQGAAQDMESATDAFAASTNYPGYYFHGDPGSLAGSMAVELPVLKLTDMDQELVEGMFRAIIDEHIRRGREVEMLTERRPLTEEERLAGREPDADGLVERDFSYEFAMPEALRRNRPELTQMVADTLAAIDPAGVNPRAARWAFGKLLTDVFEEEDVSAIIDEVLPLDEQGEPAPPGGGSGEGEATTTGADGQQHTSANPTGARQQSDPVGTGSRAGGNG